MAADWVTAVTSGITALAALSGQAIAGRIQGRNQERIEARQRLQQAAEVLAEVSAFLTDVTPDQLGFNASKEWSREILGELEKRRQRIRTPCSPCPAATPPQRSACLLGSLRFSWRTQ